MIGGSLLFKNPLNRGGKFNVDVDYTRFYRNVALQYEFPRPFGLPITSSVRAYSNRFAHPLLPGEKRSLYRMSQDGGLLGLNWDRYKRLHCGLNLGVENVKISEISEPAAYAIDFDLAMVGDRVSYVFLEPNLIFDRFDNKTNPTSGTFTFASLKFMGSARHKSCFFKALLEHSGCISMNPIVLFLRARIGHIFYQRFSHIMPHERFFLGGQHSVRSYDKDMCPSLGSFVSDNGDIVRIPKGGKTLLNFNGEVRFPLRGGLRGAVFQDFGILVSGDIRERGEAKISAGSGFGLRYAMPIGEIRFDIGWKWRKSYQSEARYAWFFSIGNSF